ncbi:DUF4175 family protein [Brevundimonas bacteroides]|uniref:DUF4175 family protein n=1 Tax=Brevundimonas bacteroides TaxID=74311 RepID=UPI000495093D|nr:DUF4175 family protein [Brevundimonas bacteroides]
MTAIPLLLQPQRRAQWRALFDTLAVGLPVAIVAGALGWRLAGWSVAALLVLLTLGLVTGLGIWRARRLDQGWLIRSLDARLSAFEDSAALLFADVRALDGFRALQRRRLETRAEEAARLDLRPDWSLRPIAMAWGAALIVAVAILFWPATRSESSAPAASVPTAAAGPPVLSSFRLRIVPPAYTGLPAREQATLDASVPEGSRLEWTVGLSPAPASAALSFPEAAPLPLVRAGEAWFASRVATQPFLYRVEAPDLARQRLGRIDVVADAPPAIRLIEPDSQLVQITPGQTRWTVVFEASDDYGVLSAATLRITLAKGEGENVTVTETTRGIAGTGEARQRRYAVTFDLAREGMEPASDMIVQLIVTDNRPGGTQRVEGPSVILRWPSALGLADGLDGMAQSVLPAYFRSQRQIIIDSEALIAEQRRLDRPTFVSRSNALGADQATLRNRYGQFMGGENEPGAIALPTNDAPARPAPPPLPTNDAPASTTAQTPARTPARPALEDGHSYDDGHDHGPAPEGGGFFGSAVDVLNEFGHAHDTGDAATLFDPGTRSTLSQALDAMWASERALRQGEPAAALPHAYRALDLLKEAQEATRIFLRRVGSDLPPIDMARRLTGERDDIVAGALAPVPERGPETSAVAAWRALEERPGRRPELNLEALDSWVRQNPGRIADPLALRAAIDTVRAEPGCADCRRRLRALLWTAIQPPATAVDRRPTPPARGRRYLDVLR